jgi:ATP phosphoribosyltransferase
MMDGGTTLRLAVPSDGALHEPTLVFLRACGVEVMRTNLRRYTAEVPAVPGLSALFQRSADITAKVEEGSADLGVVGLDRFLELRQEGSDANVVIENLGFGRCELAIGVPDSWIDVTSVADLADLSMEFREGGSDLRIATKYPRLVERFLLTNGVSYFSLVQSSGTLEAAPAMGYADIIVDISSTGTTMRENRLKPVHGGSVMTSEACLIANRATLASNEAKLARARAVVELIEAHLRALEFYSVTANMKGESPDQLAGYVLEHTDISGLRGPTISKVHTGDGGGWYAVTIVIERGRLLEAVGHLRAIGGTSVTVSQPNYVFSSESAGQAGLT